MLIQIGVQPLGDLNTRIDLNFNVTEWSKNGLLSAYYPGVPGNMPTGDGDKYSYVGFSLINYNEVYLGDPQRSGLVNSPFNLSSETTPSMFGDVHYRAFNMTWSAFTGTQAVMSVSGLRCRPYREHGVLNGTRSSTNESNTKTWTISSVDFSADPMRKGKSSLTQNSPNLNGVVSTSMRQAPSVPGSIRHCQASEGLRWRVSLQYEQNHISSLRAPLSLRIGRS